jgi:hypothetical protein
MSTALKKLLRAQIKNFSKNPNPFSDTIKSIAKEDFFNIFSERDGNGITLMHYAAMQGDPFIRIAELHSDFTEQLIRVKTSDGQSILEYLCYPSLDDKQICVSEYLSSKGVLNEESDATQEDQLEETQEETPDQEKKHEAIRKALDLLQPIHLPSNPTKQSSAIPTHQAEEDADLRLALELSMHEHTEQVQKTSPSASLSPALAATRGSADFVGLLPKRTDEARIRDMFAQLIENPVEDYYQEDEARRESEAEDRLKAILTPAKSEGLKFGEFSRFSQPPEKSAEIQRTIQMLMEQHSRSVSAAADADSASGPSRAVLSEQQDLSRFRQSEEEAELQRAIQMSLEHHSASGSASSDNQWYDSEQLRHTIMARTNAKEVRICDNLEDLRQSLSDRVDNLYVALNVNVESRNFQSGANNHWVGLHLTQDSEGPVIRYVDPMGQEANPEIIAVLSESVSRISQPTIWKKIQFIQKLDQSDVTFYEGNTNDCGPMLSYLFQLSSRNEIWKLFPLNHNESIELGQRLRKEDKEFPRDPVENPDATEPSSADSFSADAAASAAAASEADQAGSERKPAGESSPSNYDDFFH